MVGSYINKREEIMKFSSSIKQEELNQARTELVKEINEKIKISVETELLGTDKYNAEMEYAK
jgi:hypothetical protein